MKIFIESPFTSPYLNLAMEQYVFDEMPRDKQYFILWQNENAIIIGKHQNTLAEINYSYVKSHNISVVRRLSGGGAVFHDYGNINYTLIGDVCGQETIDFRTFSIPLINTLHSIGINASLSGRNDIIIDGKKCCGQSQYSKRQRIMHHGCILFDSNLTVLSEALNSKPEKYKYKGTASVKSRVANIKPYLNTEISSIEFKRILKEKMFMDETLEEYFLTETDIARINEIASNRYNTWAWNYGHSLEYNMCKKGYFPNTGFIELQLNIDKKGIITDFHSFGDYFSSTENIDELKNRIIGTRLNENDLYEALTSIDIGLFYNNLSTQDFINLLFDNRVDGGY